MAKVKHIRQFTIGPLVPVDRFNRGKHYVKVVTEDRTHHGMMYKEGLNIDIEPLGDPPKASPAEGRIYFTTLEFLPHLCGYGALITKSLLIAELTIPDNAKLVLDPNGREYKTDKVNVLKFWDMNDFLEYVKYVEISCNADFRLLKSARGLEHLERIGGMAFFSNLKSAKGLESLRSIGGRAGFFDLETAKGLDSLESIGENAYFENITSTRGLENLESIGGAAFFNNLKKEEVVHIKIGESLRTKEGWNE